MAYKLKYTLLCTSRKGNLYKTKIFFDGYEGAEINRDVPVNPFKLRKDKAAFVSGTSFEFAIRERVDFEFMEFYSNNSKKVKVEFYGPGDVLLWTGYNLPQQYQVPYTPAPANVCFTATDGLGLLKNESFGLTGRKSQMEMIVYCIDKIGLGLGYSIALTLFHPAHNENRSPLEQTFENAEVFGHLNCYQVLEELMKKYNSFITQIKGRWSIIRKADIKSSRMRYSAAGVFEGTEEAPAVLVMGMPGNEGVSVWPRGSLSMSIDPGAKEVTIKRDYGRRNSLFTNPAFDWSVDGDFVPEARYVENGAYVFIPGKNDTEQFLHKTISLENAPGEDFVFSVKMAAVGSRLYGGIPIAVMMDITMVVQLSDGVNARWLKIHDDDKTAEWTATPTDITRSTASTIGGEPRFREITVITPELPFSGNLTVMLGRYHSMDGINDSAWTIGGVAYADLIAHFVADGQLYPSGFEARVSFTGSTEPGNLGTLEILTGDAPDVPNAAILYKNITFLSDGTPT